MDSQSSCHGDHVDFFCSLFLTHAHAQAQCDAPRLSCRRAATDLMQLPASSASIWLVASHIKASPRCVDRMCGMAGIARIAFASKQACRRRPSPSVTGKGELSLERARESRSQSGSRMDAARHAHWHSAPRTTPPPRSPSCKLLSAPRCRAGSVLFCCRPFQATEAVTFSPRNPSARVPIRCIIQSRCA